MQEVEIDGRKYRTGRLTAFEQFHLTRKLMPILSGMGETFSQIGLGTAGTAPNGSDTMPPQFWNALQPVSQAIADMSKDDSEFILKTCLKAVTVFNGSTYVNVTTPTGDLMFEDIDMMAMLQLSFAVIQDNLGNFFPAPRQNGL